ncbi:MAG: acyl-CoA/acyl-ACP dehydrogenase [Actinomycetia bacterium]|nr:acyl-CoA/acyl-ACP dehydrogenase [Actinomycetes bacterium]
MSEKLTVEALIDDLSPAERQRAERVEAVLPALRDKAVEGDREGEFPTEHVKTLSEAGLLGLAVPEQFGGLGGGLRDIVGACFAMGTACPSTALSFFFHNSSASRGLLPLEALDAGLFDDEEAPVVKAFAERLLTRMGEGRWMANFASESAKSASSAITIGTSAEPGTDADGNKGWRLTGVKSFGCATGVADDYLVAAKLPGGDTAEYLAVFMVDRRAEGVGERERWDAIGMRATATHGITLEDVFVPEADALAIPGAFVNMMQVSRGSFVGSQVAGTACYLGAAQAIYDYAINHLTTSKFADTGEPIGTAPFQQQLIGSMSMHLGTARHWLLNQLDLETSEPPKLPKPEVVANWRIAKGVVAEEGFAVAQNALKACGTSNTAFSGLVSRMYRDLTMGLVQAFPAERGRLEAASTIVKGHESTQFGGTKSGG